MTRKPAGMSLVLSKPIASGDEYFWVPSVDLPSDCLARARSVPGRLAAEALRMTVVTSDAAGNLEDFELEVVRARLARLLPGRRPSANKLYPSRISILAHALKFRRGCRAVALWESHSTISGSVNLVSQFLRAHCSEVLFHRLRPCHRWT